MADNVFNGNQWPDSSKPKSPPLGTGEGEAPLAPPAFPGKPEVDVRTFASDVKSMEDSGGGPPKPYAPAPPPSPAVPEKKSFSEVFDAGRTEAPPAPAPAIFPETMVGGMVPRKSKKGLFVAILVVIIIVGLGALGYFFVYPLFFGGEEAAVVQTPPAQAPVETPSLPQVPVVPTPTSTEEVIPPPPEETKITEHASLLKTASDATVNVFLSVINPGNWRGVIEFATSEVPVLKEIILKNGEGEFITFPELMGGLLPDVFTGEVNQSFALDFTLLTYTDGNGTWPAFVGKTKAAVTPALEAQVARIEASANLANLYLRSPGTSTVWRSGTTEGVSNRYLTWSEAGAGLNYGWSGDILVVGTSYSAFRETLRRLK